MLEALSALRHECDEGDIKLSLAFALFQQIVLPSRLFCHQDCLHKSSKSICQPRKVLCRGNSSSGDNSFFCFHICLSHTKTMKLLYFASRRGKVFLLLFIVTLSTPKAREKFLFSFPLCGSKNCFTSQSYCESCLEDTLKLERSCSEADETAINRAFRRKYS